MPDARARRRKEEGPAQEPEDAFVESTVRFWTWMQHNGRTVILGVVAIGAVVAGTLYYLGYRQTVRERAAVELQQIRGSSTVEPLTRATQLESFVNRYDGTPSADEGRLLLARIQLDFGQTVEAIQTLERADGSLDRPTGIAARHLLAAAYEQSGEVEVALRTLEQIGSGAQFPFQRRLARAESARVLTDNGRLDEAAAIYQELLAGDTDALVEQSEYRIRLGEVRALQAAARQGPARPQPGSEPDQSQENPSDPG